MVILEGYPEGGRKMEKRTFYKTIVTVEILHEEPLSAGLSLEDIDYLITEGHCSGEVSVSLAKELTEDEMKASLISQGSDPEFFGIES
jgi:hypothetical protein